ncbi:radical SAM/SPASM family putative metalloenzyme maturase [Thermodesulfovibrio sp.]|uniref:radical SAM/SPASM family putative metalloenzyme maturase n=1 Tax=Thermodesulfovibrio sp. TaxID=2067987 RepID=UPI0030A804E8
MLPERLSVEITTRCNLHCNICPKQSPNYHQPEMDMDIELFKKLTPIFSNIHSLVLSGIGEPLLHEELESFIALARDKMAENTKIGFQTNGVLLTDYRMKELLKAGLNKICVSIDSIIPINGLHEPEFARRALEVIHRAKRDSKIVLESGIQIVMTKNNLSEIIPTLVTAIDYSIDFVIISHLIPYSKDATNLVVYETNNEDSVKVFKKWLNKLTQKGYKLEDWMEQMKRKAMPEFFPEENEPLKLFKSMYEEAEKKGLTLNMNNLINRDDALITDVQKILKEVSLIARKNNLSIQIPGTNPLPKRRCDFLEEKCMFIGVDGEVSPCYFLWHDFTCYIGGLKKSVKRWSFGNIKEKETALIYNSSEYIDFYESVLKYDFPYCYDCNFALCDLMELEDFVYDCYTNTVPCGACLWCGGLFYCMI